jgi:formylglycine-generating enzyme required for sulfatase activity
VVVLLLACTGEQVETTKLDSGAQTTVDTGSINDGCDPGPTPTCPAEMVVVPGSCGAISVRPFCADLTEVTVNSYRACADAGKCDPPDPTVTRQAGVTDAQWAQYNALCNAGSATRGNHPMNCVSARAADAYCAFVAKRLPTDEEWTWMAQGGPATTTYPWGEETPGTRPCWKTGSTCVVGSHMLDSTPFGVLDLAGNVSEWTSTPWSEPGTRVGRGGAWTSTAPSQLTVAAHADDTHRFNIAGFRCVK